MLVIKIIDLSDMLPVHKKLLLLMALGRINITLLDASPCD